MSSEKLWTPNQRNGDGGFTRRRLLEFGAAGALVMGAGSLLSACSGGAPDPGTPLKPLESLGGGKPVRGGTLRLGMITGGASETLNPAVAATYTDLLRSYQLYDHLFRVGADIQSLEPELALSAEPNKDATSWTIRLRDGVNWHDGKPFTADDVLWTIQSWSSSASYANGIVRQFIDFKAVRKDGPLAVVVPLVRPAAEFASLLTYVNCSVIQNGAAPDSFNTQPVGTGPFKFESFNPGSQSVFTRNQEYWGDAEKPYIDKLVIDSSFNDENSRNYALLGGQIDVAPLYASEFAKRQLSSKEVNVLGAAGTQANYFTMRVSEGPFADVRVRQAMKLLVDRQALVDGVFNGLGRVGNDIYVTDVAYILEDVTAAHDIDKAKSLLKAAGAASATLTLQTVAGVPRYLNAATLLAEQAKKAGLNVKVEPIPYSTYFTAAAGWPAPRSFGQDAANTVPSLTAFAAGQLLVGCQADETGWNALPDSQTKLDQAISEPDPSRASELWGDVQRQQVAEGGHLVWGFSDWLDAASKKVGGLRSGKAGPLNDYRVLDAWLTQ
jgi:peptide/nickel transport system substrate-binding protein